MPEDPIIAKDSLSDLNDRLANMLQRISEGEDVPEEELEILAMSAHSQLEELRNQMAEIVGEQSPEELRAHARASLNDEEYAVYLEDQKTLEAYRQRKQEPENGG